MLYYVCTRSNAQTLGPLILYYRPDLQRIVRFLPYDRLNLLTGIEFGVVVWTDLDRLDRDETQRAIDVGRNLSATRPGILQLNQPAASLRRFDLMRTLYVAGINSFNVFRLHEAPHVERFPVFIRRESGVSKKAPPLLDDADALNSALASLRSNATDRADLMIVELGNAADGDGYFRKYGAYRIGDHVYPQHVVLARQWYAKFPDYRHNPAQKAAQNAYFDHAPDIETLMGLFKRARIEYGRMDYCLVGGRVEVFEINTNPSVLNNPPTRFDRFDYKPWADRHTAALIRLNGATIDDDLATTSATAIRTVHGEIIEALKRKYARRRAKRTISLAVRRLVAVLSPGKAIADDKA